MKKLHQLTLQWASDRLLLQNGNIQTQALKLGSEFGELCGNLANNNEIEDDIGDCLVVCTILASLAGNNLLRDITSIDPVQHNTPSVPTAAMYLGHIQDYAIKGKNFRNHMIDFIHQLEGIAITRHTTLKKSWEVAYEDIKDRKGHLNEHGNFIKEEK